LSRTDTPFASKMGIKSHILFRAGGQRFSIDAASVREVVPLPRLARVPLAPPHLIGLTNLRGETLAVLAPHASEADSEPWKARQLLVLEGEKRIALAVERVEQLRTNGGESTDKGDEKIFPLDVIVGEAFSADSRHAPRSAAPSARDRREAGDLGERLPLLCFEIANQVFALPVEEVEEVMPLPPSISRLPRAAASMIGSVEHRGRLLGIASLAHMLGLPADGGKSKAERQKVVVARIGAHHLGLVVEQVTGIHRARPSRIDPVPSTLVQPDGEASIRAICRDETGARLISILSSHHLLRDEHTKGLLSLSPTGTVTAANSSRSEEIALLAVRMGTYRIGFPLGAVDRIMQMPGRIARLPGTPEWLRGVAHNGGKPVLIVDPVLRLTGARAAGAKLRVIIVAGAETSSAYLVDAIDGVIKLPRDRLHPAPLPAGLSQSIFGDVATVSGADAREEPLLVMRPQALFATAEHELAARAFSGRTALQ